MRSKLTTEEKEILQSYENDEWESVATPQLLDKYRDSAKATFRKDRRVNIRISSKDLISIQELALRDGIPYQTLMSSILHKYVSGRLREAKD
ncbi:MAG: antitoxin [Thiotrichales bacterium]